MCSYNLNVRQRDKARILILKNIIVHTDDFAVVILKISEKYVIILIGIFNHKESICQCSYIRERKLNSSA